MELSKTLEKLKNFSRKLPLVSEEDIVAVLNDLADHLRKKSKDLILANQKDLEKMDKGDSLFDRVLLNEERVLEMAKSVETIASYDSPIGEVLEEKILGNGLNLKKVRTPIGVIGVIFEARPNVIVDVFSLCFKSRNVCVLKGGSQSAETNAALMELIVEVLSAAGFADAAYLLPNDRELVTEMLRADEHIDVIIPRGGASLIRFVRDNATVPVIETGAGVVHTYFDKEGDVEKGKKIVFNAKTSRPSVCNALDTLLIHEERVSDLPEICRDLKGAGVEIKADERAFAVLKDEYSEELISEAEEEDFGIEYLSLKMSVKVMKDLEEAIEHINIYGSGHSEAIITENKEVAGIFLKAVDAACVYVNASTRFTDGGVFGLGAEIGISTQKLHARGPMGIKELTSYKWEVRGDGQVR